MTGNERTAIERMRRSGLSYQEIADNLAIRKEAVRSYCRNHNINPDVDGMQDKDICPVCGKPLKKASGKGRRRRFCSDSCRMEWWKNHPSEKGHDIRRIRVYKCAGCGKLFCGYGSTERKYCSHECYISHRFGNGA